MRNVLIWYFHFVNNMNFMQRLLVFSVTAFVYFLFGIYYFSTIGVSEASLLFVGGVALILLSILLLGMPGSDFSSISTNEYANMLREPLHETTRKNRRNLLFVSSTGLVMTVGNVIPQKIEALGITFSSIDQENLYFLVSIVILYFLITFFVYVRSDIFSILLVSKEQNSTLVYSVIARTIYEALMPFAVACVSLLLVLREQAALFERFFQ